MSRREAIKHLLGAALAATALGARSAQNGSSKQVFNVQHFGARADGKSSDLSAIQKAIDAATGTPEAELLFPPGEYWLGEVGPMALLRLSGVRHLHVLGDNATLRCRTTAGISNVFRLTGSQDVSISGLSFTDDGFDRSVNWKGAVAIQLSGDDKAGCSDINVSNCQFDHVLTAVAASGQNGVVRNISLQNLRVQRSYYGLNFQNNGDRVRGRSIHFNDVKRSYFPYGVDDHDLEFVTENNATGFTDILIKCYSKPTTNLVINAQCAGKRGGDAIVAFDQQHDKGEGAIRGIRVKLDVTDADCALQNVFLFRSFTPEGKIEPATTSTWSDIELDGQFEFCEAKTQLIGADSIPARATVIRLGFRISQHRLSSVHRPGFAVAPVQ